MRNSDEMKRFSQAVNHGAELDLSDVYLDNEAALRLIVFSSDLYLRMDEKQSKAKREDRAGLTSSKQRIQSEAQGAELVPSQSFGNLKHPWRAPGGVERPSE